MRTSPVNTGLGPGVAALVAVLMLTALPTAAAAQDTRSFTMAGRQWLLMETMTNSALLAALGVDASPRLSAVHWSRDRFDRTQRELRHGAQLLGTRPATRPEIIETLDRVDIHWQHYETIFTEIAATGTATEFQIDALTATHASAIEALGTMVDTYEHFVHGGRNHSILSATMDGVGQLRARTQLVLRGLLMVAHLEDDDQASQDLAQATAEFDRTLNGLINGDADLRLLPAPTQDIRDELLKVDSMWRGALPILQSAAAGSAVSPDEIAEVAQYASDMAVPLTVTLIMYMSL